MQNGDLNVNYHILPYNLRQFNITMENGRCTGDLPIEIVIFHSYVKLPEGSFICLCLPEGKHTRIASFHTQKKQQLGNTLEVNRGCQVGTIQSEHQKNTQSEHIDGTILDVKFVSSRRGRRLWLQLARLENRKSARLVKVPSI